MCALCKVVCWLFFICMGDGEKDYFNTIMAGPFFFF